MSAHPVPGVHLVRLARSRAYLLEGETSADGLTLIDEEGTALRLRRV
jgi:hypothetical protein